MGTVQFLKSILLTSSVKPGQARPFSVELSHPFVVTRPHDDQDEGSQDNEDNDGEGDCQGQATHVSQADS